MSRIALVVPANTDTKVAATLAQIKAGLGNVPNVFALLANAPVALDGYLSLSKALSPGRLTGRQREILALAIALFKDVISLGVSFYLVSYFGKKAILSENKSE